MEHGRFEEMVEEVATKWTEDPPDPDEDDADPPQIYWSFPNEIGGVTRMQAPIHNLPSISTDLTPAELCAMALFTLDAVDGLRDSHGDRLSVELLCSGRLDMVDGALQLASSADPTRYISLKQVAIHIAQKYHYHANEDPWGADLESLFTSPWAMPPNFPSPGSTRAY